MRGVAVPETDVVVADGAALRWRDRTDLEVEHVGRSAVLLRASEEFVPVAAPARGLAPGGVVLAAPQAFDVLVERLRAVGSGGPVVLDVRPWSRARIVLRDLHLATAAGPPEAVPRLARQLAVRQRTVPGLSPAAQRAAARPLARDAVRGDGAAVRARLANLVGAGPGSTPAGDDVVVGLLAGLHVAGGPAADRAAALVADQVRPLLARTTRPSAHDLAAACDGRFAEYVHHLAAAAAGRVPARDAVDRAARHGATSGLDLTHGLLAALVEAAAGADAVGGAATRAVPDLRRSA